ncbi:MAG: ACT domain-containing protein, partial [Armatimonadetes bacterium]|nr:ACT domain-containing protein [Armatimonadota bacterium]
MCAKQVSIFLENKAGRLADVCTLLGQEGINIRAFCIADTSDFGILRLIVNDPDRAAEALRQAGHAVSETDVLVAQLEDRPGGLAAVLEALRDS